MRAFSIRFLVGAALALNLVSAPAADTIKVAYIAPLSGSSALIFEETLIASVCRRRDQ